MTDVLAYRRRSQAPTSFERRLGFTAHQGDKTFSLGVNTRAAPTYDPDRNNRANARVAPRHYWLGSGGCAPTDLGWQ